mmetsp:Transcript_9644/g.29393  ORF Transcript_9644/g.29393 Transcript_9644/m.29393 type:complete len:137 (-) Transcript_9644:568-978(-)
MRVFNGLDRMLSCKMGVLMEGSILASGIRWRNPQVWYPWATTKSDEGWRDDWLRVLRATVGALAQPVLNARGMESVRTRKCAAYVLRPQGFETNAAWRPPPRLCALALDVAFAVAEHGRALAHCAMFQWGVAGCFT